MGGVVEGKRNMNIEFIPQKVVQVLRLRGYADDTIAGMSARKLFTVYAEWNGVPMPETLFDLVVELSTAHLASQAAEKNKRTQ